MQDRAWFISNFAPQPSQTLERFLGIHPYRRFVPVRNSSGDRVVPQSTDGIIIRYGSAVHCNPGRRDRALLPKFESLEVLEMPSSLVSEKGLTKTLSSIGPSNITTTKLRVLDLTKRITGVPIGEEVRAALDFWCMYQFFNLSATNDGHHLHFYLLSTEREHSLVGFFFYWSLLPQVGGAESSQGDQCERRSSRSTSSGNPEWRDDPNAESPHLRNRSHYFSSC